jgi:DNA polymerase-1
LSRERLAAACRALKKRRVDAVLLLDTSSLFFRAHHALPPMSTRAGEPTAALYGFAALLLKLLREGRPKGLAFALDARGPMFRHALYSGYKEQRPPLPDALGRQLARLPAILDAFGVPVHRAPGFEADDVLATLASRLRADGERARIVSGDRDLFQTIRDGVDVLFVGHRGGEPAVYDVAAVTARFGVPPQRLPSYAALVGDPSDNLPRVPGIGPRTAAKLVARFGDVATLLEHRDQIESGAIRSALLAAADTVTRNEDLARLRSDVPLGDGPLWAPLPRDAAARLRTVFGELEFKSLLPRLEGL